MEIVNFETYVVQSTGKGRVLVKIETDEDIHGIGEGSAQTKSRAVVEAINVLSQYFMGRDPFHHERLFQEMYRNEWFSDNVINLTALAAIDTALWDIKGKALDQPLYNLLGGPMKDDLKVKAYFTGRLPKNDNLDEYEESAKQLKDDGIKALKFDPFGDAWLRMSPDELELSVEKVRTVKEAVGTDVDVLLEGHCRFTPGAAIQVIKELEEFNPGWFEEPTLPDNNRALRKVSERSTIPIAAGEHEHSKYSHQELITETNIDIVQPDLVNAGGPTEGKKIAAIAESEHISFAPHNSNGVVGTAMTLHVALSCPNFMVQEVTSIADDWWEIVDNPIEFDDGYFVVPDGPGLGMDLDMDAVRKYEVTDDRQMEAKTGRWAMDHP